MRTGSYASLSITMVWVENLFKAGTAIVSAVASGGGEGLFNISWGAEEDFAASFWRALRDQNPSFEFREYGESFWDSGIEFQDLDRGSPASDLRPLPHLTDRAAEPAGCGQGQHERRRG